jgi:hypothetical protein
MVLTEEPPTMSKNKRPDQHTSKFFLRLPEGYRAPLTAESEDTGLPMTVIVQIALEKHFRDVGRKFTPNWPKYLKRPSD